MDRALLLWEQRELRASRVSAPAPTASAPAKFDEVPADLLTLALSESEVWAREQALKHLMELAHSHDGDWHKVRNEVFAQQGAVFH